MQVNAAGSATGRLPLATYRVQLTAAFTFDDARELIDYLHNLGVSELYCSPLSTARSGSAHGYDVVDPTRINPELGGEDAFRRLADALRQSQMGLMLDIVPNHMALSPENHAWMHVLEFGQASPYAAWFDVDWQQGPVVLPILGTELNTAVAEGTLAVRFLDGRFVVQYHDWKLPINWPSVSAMIKHADAESGEPPQLHELRKQLEELARDGSEQSQPAFRSHLASFAQNVAQLANTDAGIRAALQEVARQVTASPQALLKVLSLQVYRPCYWREAGEQLNYRRFFDINDLIGIRAEDPSVFEQTHELVIRLLRQGDVSSLRIDHIDGLAQPQAYLHMLNDAAKHAAGQDASAESGPYIVVEKILEGDESLPENWRIHGTTGYDFLNAVNELFICPDGLAVLGECFQEITGQSEAFADRVRRIKAQIAVELFPSELVQLVQLLQACEGGHALADLREAIIAAASALPVYRCYCDSTTLSQRDRDILDRTFDQVSQTAAMALLRRIVVEPTGDQTHRRFIVRWQQFTGPLMAKGLEDTALYQDARLISLNEVGMSPQSMHTPRGVSQFHDMMLQRREHWPGTMNATATHDTKRGEDARMRISVLSQMDQAWTETATRWITLNARLKASHREQLVPDRTTELFVYQTALGAWPVDGVDHDDIVQRLTQYINKVSREAKQHTSWLEPDEVYERLVSDFIERVFALNRGDQFTHEFQSLLENIAWHGGLRSLSQTLLRCTAPGVPDLYQGAEYWDLSMVDPDNRRPVDLRARRDALAQLRSCAPADITAELIMHWRDGRIKLFVIHRALQARQQRRALFQHGMYIPLRLTGQYAAHICAFARRHEQQWAITVAPIRSFFTCDSSKPPLGRDIWGDTVLELPADAPQTLFDQMTNQTLETHAGSETQCIHVGDVLQAFPVALLLSA